MVMVMVTHGKRISLYSFSRAVAITSSHASGSMFMHVKDSVSIHNAEPTPLLLKHLQGAQKCTYMFEVVITTMPPVMYSVSSPCPNIRPANTAIPQLFPHILQLLGPPFSRSQMGSAGKISGKIARNILYVRNTGITSSSPKDLTTLFN